MIWRLLIDGVDGCLYNPGFNNNYLPNVYTDY